MKEAIPPQMQPNRYRDLWFKLIATVLMIVIIGLIINNLLSANETSVFETTTESKSIRLPDDSEVILYKNSKLTIKKKFGVEKRVLNLEGEAIFNVKSDPTKPFVILTQRATIEAEGGSFHVQAYKATQDVSVEIKTGRASIYVPQLQETLEISEGERGVFKKSERKLSKEKQKRDQ